MSETGFYVRRCQSCGHKQKAKPVSEYKGETWRNLKCKQCHSEDMDYGSSGWVEVNGKLVRPTEEEE